MTAFIVKGFLRQLLHLFFQCVVDLSFASLDINQSCNQLFLLKYNRIGSKEQDDPFII